MITFTIIESPYGRNPDGSAADSFTLLRNIEYVRAAMADCFARGEIPLASHALYTQPGVLDDRVDAERRKGMEAGFVLREALRGVERYEGERYMTQTACYEDLGVTPGMQSGLERSVADGVPVVFRKLGGWS